MPKKRKTRKPTTTTKQRVAPAKRRIKSYAKTLSELDKIEKRLLAKEAKKDDDGD